MGVHEALLAAGDDLGVANGGYYTIDSLRLEKGYRAFGRELTPDYTPVDAGLLFACKLKTDIPFLGRDAVEQARAAGARRKLVSFLVDDAEAMLWGGELVLRDGVPRARSPRPPGVRRSAPASASPTSGTRAAGPSMRPGCGPRDEVAVGSAVLPISVSLRPRVDPDGVRIRSSG